MPRRCEREIPRRGRRKKCQEDVEENTKKRRKENSKKHEKERALSDCNQGRARAVSRVKGPREHTFVAAPDDPAARARQTGTLRRILPSYF